MTYCRICIDDMKKPVSLPCGHIFCSECIVKTVKNVKPNTFLHPCPICRSIYTIAPINPNTVPLNLRPFVTPSIRRVYLDSPNPDEKGQNEPASQLAIASMTSELERLRAENEALRSNCVMWRKRAEMHGAANLGLINFAKAVRDQAGHLARDRENLQTRCRSLSRKIEDFHMAKYVDSELTEPLFDANDQSDLSKKPDPTSLLFAPPFRFPSEPAALSERTGKKRTRSQSSEGGDVTSGSTSPPRPEKRSRSGTQEPQTPTEDPPFKSLPISLINSLIGSPRVSISGDA